MAIAPRLSPSSGSNLPQSTSNSLLLPRSGELGGLRRLTLEVLRAAGADVEEVASRFVDVLVPEERQQWLGGAGFLRLAFDPEDAAADVAAQYVAVGSPLAERIVALGQQLGVVARWYVNGLRWSRRRAISLDRWQVKLTNARFLPSTGVELAFACHHILFCFRVAYVSDEKREELRTVVVDAISGQSAPLLERIWESLPEDFAGEYRFPESLRPTTATWAAPVSIAVRPEAPLLEADELPGAESLAALFHRAGDLLRVQLAGGIGAYRRRAARHLEMERLRLEAFYDDSEAELRKRLVRAESDERRRSVDLKLEANRLDREHKLVDIVAKHQLRVVATPLSAAVITQPKVRTHVRIENRYASTELTVILNPLTGQLEPVTCRSCGEATTSIHLCANGHVVCDGCVRRCAFCQREYCRDCGVASCAVCGRPVCLHSQVTCSTCGRITCHDDRNRCH